MTTPRGQWMLPGYAIMKAKEAMEREGWHTLPGQKILTRAGYHGLSNAIWRHYGGYRNFRAMLDSREVVPLTNWPDIHYTLDRARQLMKAKSLMSLPAARALQNMRESSLAVAICKYHGGFNAFRKRLGEEPLRVDRDSWKSLDYTIQQAHIAMKQEGWRVLPSSIELRDAGHSSLDVAISKYHGGAHQFRKQLGQDNGRLQTKMLKDRKHMVREVRRVMRKMGWARLPSENVLRDACLHYIPRAITNHHGGMIAFRESLGQENTKRVNGLWRNLTYAIKQANSIMVREGWSVLPSNETLREFGYSSLSSVISKYYGGFPAFRAKLAEYTGQPTEKQQLEDLLEDYVGDE